jgi:hypothetical protein
VTCAVDASSVPARRQGHDAPADLLSITAVTLLRRHGRDAAVAVPGFVQIQKICYPQAGLLHNAERPVRVIGSVFRRAEQRFRVGVVVGDPWSGKGCEHSQLLQPAFQRGRADGVAAIGMEDQCRVAALADPLSEVGPAHLDPPRWSGLNVRQHPRPPPCGSRHRSPGKGKATRLAAWPAGS